MRNRPLLYVCLMMLSVMIMAVVCSSKWSFVKELRPSSLEKESSQGDEVIVEGQVYRIEPKETYQAVYLKKNSIELPIQKKSFQESKIIIYIDPEIQVQIGNIIRVQGEVSSFQNARNPGNFDQKRYYQIQDIHGIVWGRQVSVIDENIWKARTWLSGFRSRWKDTLADAMGAEDGATLSAMMLGEKSEMDQDLKSLYQANGIGHILAISGLHLSFIGVGMYQMLRRLTGSYTAGGIAGILFLALFILMIGLTVSALRAFVMFLFRVGADMTGRHYDAPTALAAAAAVTLLWRPLYLYDGGFWLSFGAVLGILAVLPILQELPGGMLLKLFGASISIHSIILPVMLYYFFEFPLYSFLLNLFIIPMMSVLLFLGMLGSLWYVSVLPGSSICFKVCKMILWIYKKSCEIAIRLPGARVVTGQPEIWQIAVYYGLLVLGLGLLRWINRTIKKEKDGYKKQAGTDKESEDNSRGIRDDIQKRRIILLRSCAWILCFLAVLLLMYRWGETGQLKAAALDVGQGDCVYLKGPEGSTYLVDGGSSDVKKAGQYRIEPFLKSQGVRELDYVFVTHGDSDHTSGIEEMLERQDIGVRIRTLVLPVQDVWDEALGELARKAKKTGTKVAVIEEGQVLEEGGMTLECLQPGSSEEELEPGNAASMILAVHYEGFDMLLTGDVEAEGEDILTEKIKNQYSDCTWEVLKVAHHGSKNSSDEEFLEVMQPRIALISAGQQNRYGHPHQETLDRLEEAGSITYSTQESGAILISVKEGKVCVREYL